STFTRGILPWYSTSATLTAQGLEAPSTVVDLTVSGCPAGASCSFDSRRIIPTVTTGMTVVVGDVPAGSYPLTITATGGGTTKTTTVTLVVKNLEFTLAGDRDTGAKVPGGFAVSYAVTATLVEQGTIPASTFVDLTVSGCPAGASCSFDSRRITPTVTTGMTVVVGDVRAGSYPLTITATGGGTTKTTTVTLVVKNLEFTLA